MKRWLVRVAQVTLGAFIGSLVLENLTRFAVWQFVPHVHDVQFALLITVNSTLGGILGGVAASALLLAKMQRFKLAGWLVLLCSGLGVAFALWLIIHAQQAFDENKQPFTDALSYVGFTLAGSIILVIWATLLLFKRVIKAA